jgi:phospholipase C
VFESNGFALEYSPLTRGLFVGLAVPNHDTPTHRFILHATAPPPATTFQLQFAGSPSRGFVASNFEETTSVNSAAVFEITDLGNGAGYTIKSLSTGKHFAPLQALKSLDLGEAPGAFKIFSVTKSTDSGTGFAAKSS